MPSWGGGSTRAWRRFRLYILARDGYRCQMLDDDGHPCGAPARTVDHIDALALGGPFLPPPEKARAACARHNFGAGAAITNARRRDRARGFQW